MVDKSTRLKSKMEFEIPLLNLPLATISEPWNIIRKTRFQFISPHWIFRWRIRLTDSYLNTCNKDECNT